MTTIERRLAVLEDKDAIRGLLMTGWRALDAHDWDTWEACWTPDAVLDFGPWGTIRGREVIRAQVVAAEEPYASMAHHILNAHFEIDGDRATGFGRMWFACLADASRLGEHYDIGGSYDWEFVRTPEGWRVHRQCLTAEFTLGEDPFAAF